MEIHIKHIAGKVLLLLSLLLASSSLSCHALPPKTGNAQDSVGFRDLDQWCDSTSIANMQLEWKNDSLGCLKLRDYKLASCLVKKLSIERQDEKEVLRLLGNPNRIRTISLSLGMPQERNDYVCLEYYYDVQCNERNELEQSDRCWLRIIIHPQSRKVVGTDDVCN